MVTYPLPHDTSPYKIRPSRSTHFSSPGIAQTPSRRSRSARGSPYARPPGKSNPKELLRTPKQFIADRAAARFGTPNSTGSFPTPMGPPCTPRVVSASGTETPTRGRSSGTPRTPRYLQIPKTPSSPTREAMFIPPEGVRRTPDRALPTVQLLRVMNKCWDDDTERLTTWTIKDGYLGGRCDQPDRPDMWKTLTVAIHNVWPDQKAWIMKHIPGDDNLEWFKGTDRIGRGEGDCIEDPNITTKHSSSERVGFSMSQNTYQIACTLVQELAGSKGGLGCLLDAGINPFFIIYACADCNVPLPPRFNLELFWRHLDATLQAQCWRGLGANRALIVEESSEESTDGGEPEESLEESTGGDEPEGPAGPSEFSQTNDDPEGILESLMTITIKSEGASNSRPVHKLSIAVKGGQWIAQSELGRMWYDASDLPDKDVAPFAMLDSLTRGLPQWSGGILQISTQSVQLLWGVCGRPHSGAWRIVRALCRSHHVELRGQWAGLDFQDMALPADPRKRAALVPRRNANVVGAVVQELVMNGGNGRMIFHLTGLTAGL